MKTNPQIMSKALKALARDIQSPDGVANACIYEAACMIDEMYSWISEASEVDGMPEWLAQSARSLIQKDISNS